MSFLAPWALWLAAFAPVIVLLYLLKLRRRAVSVSTLMFWQGVLQEKRRSALFQRLRQLLSLLLHLLIFALILLAIAKPTLDRAVRAGSSTVIILDARARMQAMESDGESRLAQAVKLAAQTTRQAGELRQVAILTTAAEPAVAAPFTGDEKELRETLTRLKPSDAGGTLASAIHLADELLASRAGEKRILLITAPAAGSPPLPASLSPLTLLPVGTPRDNLAITRFATRPLPASPETSEILLEIGNFGRAAATGSVEITLDDRLLDVRPFSLAPGERRLEVFPFAPSAAPGARGWLVARLDTTDALAVDNTAFAILPAEPPRRVLLVTRGNWFLEKLLESDTRLRFELLAPEAFRLEMAAQFDAVLLDGFLPPGFDLANTPGNFLFIKETPFATSGAAIEQPLVTEVDAAHPTLRLVSLQNVTVARAAALAVPAPRDGWTFEAPLRSGDHPLLLAGTRRTASGPRRLAALAFDLAESDLPLRVAFPLLMANTIHWLAGSAAPEPRAVRVGETVALAPGETLWPEPHTGPGPAAARRDSAQGVRESFQPAKSGFYQIDQPSGSPVWLVANTGDDRESNLLFDANSPIAQTPWPPAFIISAAGWPLWQYLALAAVILLMGEWFLFHRRRTE